MPVCRRSHDCLDSPNRQTMTWKRNMTTCQYNVWKQPHPLIRTNVFILTIKDCRNLHRCQVRYNKRSSLLINSSLYLYSCTDHSFLIISKKHIITLRSPIFVSELFETALSLAPQEGDAQLGLYFPGFPARCVISPPLWRAAGRRRRKNGMRESQAQKQTWKTCFSILRPNSYAFHNSPKVLHCSLYLAPPPGMGAKNSGKCSPNPLFPGENPFHSLWSTLVCFYTPEIPTLGTSS